MKRVVDHRSTETLTDKSMERVSLKKELKENVRVLEEWLRESESVLREPLKFNQRWTRQAIDDKMEEIQNLHRDIESHSQLIKTVLWQCGEIDAQRRLKKSSRSNKKNQVSVLLSLGKIIEERWHCLWLRSLEWQCFLEQFTTAKPKKIKEEDSSATSSSKKLGGGGETAPEGNGQHLQSSGLQKDSGKTMNVSSCSDSSSLADGISSSAEAICEAEAQKNRKNSISPIRHSTPSKTGLRFIVASDSASSDIEEKAAGGTTENGSKCETTFSRTTFANNAGYPNCGTFFVKHISDDEAMYHDNGNNLNDMDENENSSAYASPNAIRKLVRGAEKLVFYQTTLPIDDSDVDYRPLSEARLRPPKTKRSHSFHASCSKYSSDVLISSGEEDEMDCERDSHGNTSSLKDASSLSQLLVDSVQAEVQSGLFNEVISGVSDDESIEEYEPHTLRLSSSENNVVPKIVVEDEGEVRSTATNEEEELSEFWDQEKYLSEHNYDEPIDVDSTLKLLNFGDDYSKFIDSMSDEFSDLDQGTVKPQRTKRKIRRSTVKGSHYDSMSDSEPDDAWKAVLLSRTKLNEVKQRLRNLEEDDQFTKNSVELTILKDVCYENIDCILKLLDESGTENTTVVVLKKTERSFKGLLKQWQEILQMIVKRLQLSEAYSKITAKVESMESQLEKVALPQEAAKPLFHSKEDLENYIERMKDSIKSLSGQKSELFQANVEIHNFLAELSCCPAVTFNTPPNSLGRKDKQPHFRQQPQLMMTTEVEEHQFPEIWLHQQHLPARKETAITKGLKDKVVALYSKWDEAFHKTNTQLVNAQTTYANLLQFQIESKRLGTSATSKLIKQHDSASNSPTNEKSQRLLQRRKKQDSLSLTEDSGISESCDDSEEAILTKMRLLAQDLEQKLSLDSNLVQEIAQTLKTTTSDLEERLQCRAHINRNCAGTQTKSTDFQDFDFEHCFSNEDEADSHIKSRFAWFKRILRFALPVQFFVMMMLFLAWNATDHSHHGYFHGGCESSRFHFLYPQLKYINGPPPI